MALCRVGVTVSRVRGGWSQRVWLYAGLVIERWVESKGVALCRVGDCEQDERWVESKGVALCRVGDCEQGERWME